MLKPALLYKEELTQLFIEQLYTEDYYFYSGYDCGSELPEIKTDYNLYQYAIIDKSSDMIIGYLSYRINVYTDTAQNFGLFSFDRGNQTIGIDVFDKLKELIRTHHKVEWKVIEGNPVKKHYDRFCKRNNGYIIHKHHTGKDLKGNYVDSYCYEIINPDK